MKNLFLFLLIFPFGCFAQQNMDSLWNIWNNSANPDTVRLQTMTQIIHDGYLYSDPDSAFYFAQIQYELAKKKGLKKEMGEALNLQGTSFAVAGNLDQAIAYFEKSLVVRTEIDYKLGMIGSYNNLGIVYSNRGDFTNSIKYYNKGVDVSNELGLNTSSF